MSNTSDQTTLQLDLRLVEMIAGIRNDIMHRLRVDQHTQPSTGNVTLCFGMLDKLAGATWTLSETERIRADTQRILAEVEKIKAETEKIKAQKM